MQHGCTHIQGAFIGRYENSRWYNHLHRTSRKANPETNVRRNRHSAWQDCRDWRGPSAHGLHQGIHRSPAQVLVVVLDENLPTQQPRITDAIKAVLPTDYHMDITELHPGDPNLPTIRATGTQLNL